MISIEKALATILADISPLKSKKVEIERCRNRVLDEDIFAPEDIPPFTNSAMDGYAVSAADLRGASSENPRILRVLEDLPAGQVSHRVIRSGEAIRIMTGAPLPSGADAVVMVEDTVTMQNEKCKISNEKCKTENVKILKSVRRGENVRKAGESVRKKELVLKKGKVLRPQEIGMLAALGYPAVKVIPPPEVAIISTGDELQEIGEKLIPGKIRDCNRYSLITMIQQYGGISVPLGFARDREKELKTKFKKALSFDMILTSGGVSVGKYDLVKKVLSEMNGEVKIWQVAMKPGKPLTFGVIRGIPVFGLPGNPVSVIVSFLQFVRPALLKLQGKNKLKKPVVEAVLTKDCDEETGRTHLVRAVVSKKGGKYYVRSTGPQGSGILRSLVLGNSLMIIPPHRGPLKKGEKVAVMLVEELEVK